MGLMEPMCRCWWCCCYCCYWCWCCYCCYYWRCWGSSPCKYKVFKFELQYTQVPLCRPLAYKTSSQVRPPILVTTQL